MLKFSNESRNPENRDSKLDEDKLQSCECESLANHIERFANEH